MKHKKFYLFWMALAVVFLILVLPLPLSKKTMKVDPSTIQFVLSEVSYTELNGFLTSVIVRGQIKNNTNKTLNNISIKVEYYDVDGKFIFADAMRSPIPELLPNQPVPFTIISSEKSEILDKIDSYILYYLFE